MIDTKKKYERYCQNRLAEYGFGDGGWNPRKYDFYKKVNAVVRVRMGLEGFKVPRGNQVFTEDYMVRAMQIMDEILPPRGGAAHGTV